MRRWTAAPPNARPRCWSGIRRLRCTSACARRRRPARCGPRSPIAIASTPTTTSSSSSARSATAARRSCSRVNPFGVQMDGALVEGVRNSGGGFGGLSQGREDVDRSPDFVFQSRGRLVDGGYEVEVRIPFKSLRYQSRCRAVWGLHVTRVSPRRRHRRQLGAGPPPGRVVPVAGRTLDEPARPAPRSGARPQPDCDRAASTAPATPSAIAGTTTARVPSSA